MSKLYITFGQIHTHSVNGKTFDKDCVAVIECDNYTNGREKAFKCFGDKFCFSYLDGEFDHEKMLQYFPRGLMGVE